MRARSEVKPPMRYWQYMAFDQGVGKVVVFGGRPSFGDNLGDTWVYDYAVNMWTMVDCSVSPSPRQSGSMVYDEGIGHVVLFGGLVDTRNALSDTWVFDTEAGEWSLLEEAVVDVVDVELQSGIPGYPLAGVFLALVWFIWLRRMG